MYCVCEECLLQYMLMQFDVGYRARPVVYIVHRGHRGNYCTYRRHIGALGGIHTVLRGNRGYLLHIGGIYCT